MNNIKVTVKTAVYNKNVTVLHILGDVSVWFQMLESVEYTK